MRTRKEQAAVRKRHNLTSARDWNTTRYLDSHKDALDIPDGAVEDFPVPKWMTPEEKELFKEFRAFIVKYNMAKGSDRHSLILLVSAYADYLEMSRKIREEGYTYDHVTKDGVVTKRLHPLIQVRSNILKDMRLYLLEFGLTPNSRRKVLKAEPDKTEDPEDAEWNDLLN
jgi:P27 family predicted phage terminase small subunit